MKTAKGTSVENIEKIIDTLETKSVTVVRPREFHPKRGFKNIEISLKDKSATFKPHHQKTLILELLEADTDHKMTLQGMVEKVEQDEKLWSRLQSKQSVFNCITYHVKELEKLGVVETK